MDRGAGQATVHEITKNQTQLSNLTLTLIILVLLEERIILEERILLNGLYGLLCDVSVLMMIFYSPVYTGCFIILI